MVEAPNNNTKTILISFKKKETQMYLSPIKVNICHNFKMLKGNT